MSKMMFSAIAAVVGLTFAGTVPSNAAQGPWCLRIVTGEQSVDMCEYRTFETCNQQRVNDGNRSHCFRNPAVFFPGQSEQAPPKSRRSAAQ